MLTFSLIDAMISLTMTVSKFQPLPFTKHVRYFHNSQRISLVKQRFFSVSWLTRVRVFSKKLPTCCRKSCRPMTNRAAFSFLKFPVSHFISQKRRSGHVHCSCRMHAAIRFRLLVRYRRPNGTQIAIIYVVGTAREASAETWISGMSLSTTRVLTDGPRVPN